MIKGATEKQRTKFSTFTFSVHNSKGIAAAASVYEDCFACGTFIYRILTIHLTVRRAPFAIQLHSTALALGANSRYAHIQTYKVVCVCAQASERVVNYGVATILLRRGRRKRFYRRWRWLIDIGGRPLQERRTVNMQIKRLSQIRPGKTQERKKNARAAKENTEPNA